MISANHVSYTVKAGDSLYTIAQSYGVSVESLRQANVLGATLQIGQSLIINDPTKNPTAKEETTNTQTPSTPTTNNNQTTTNQSANNQNTNSNQSSSTTTNSAQNQTQTNTQTPSQSTSASYNGAAIAQYAQSFIGVPYVWGGSTPNGFDCSGFTQYVYAHFGKNIGRVTTTQEYAGTVISVSQAQVGDLLFWGQRGSTYHVGIYMGNNTYLAAPEPGRSVSFGNMSYFMPSFAVHVN